MTPYVRLLTVLNAASDSYPETTGSPDPGMRPWNEGRAMIDGALVVYDLDDPPAWLAPVLAARDEDGNTRPEWYVYDVPANPDDPTCSTKYPRLVYPGGAS